MSPGALAIVNGIRRRLGRARRTGSEAYAPGAVVQGLAAALEQRTSSTASSLQSDSAVAAIIPLHSYACHTVLLCMARWRRMHTGGNMQHRRWMFRCSRAVLQCKWLQAQCEWLQDQCSAAVPPLFWATQLLLVHQLPRNHCCGV
jgi:hypothetical protein